MELMKTIKWRYSTKKFDPTKKVSSEDLKKIEALLCMSPSSTNVQPWHFVIANTEEGKKKIGIRYVVLTGAGLSHGRAA